MFVAMTIW